MKDLEEAYKEYGHELTDPDLKAKIAKELHKLASGLVQTVPPELNATANKTRMDR